MRARRWAWTLAVLAAIVTVPEANAHEALHAGPLTLLVGWHDEPAYTGVRNAVDVTISDERGTAVVVPSATLAVEVVVGDDHVELPLAPTEQPGVATASLVPTRAGTYSLRIVGTLAGQSIDVTSTCSDATFDCVHDPVDVRFPSANEPSLDDVAARLQRESARAFDAKRQADDAHRLALAALGIACVAVAAAGIVLLRTRRVRH